MPRSPSLPATLGLVLLTICGSGCRRDAAEYRIVPHEAPPPPAPGSSAMGAPSPSNAPALQWTAPATWEPQPASEMRLASYRYTGPDGGKVDVSVFSFPDAAGGLLANINRWRSQVGLAPLEDPAADPSNRAIEIAGQPSWIVDFSGTPSSAAPAMGNTPAPTGPTRILGAIIPLDGKSWFFKVMGPDTLVASQREAFQSLIASIRLAPTTAPANDPHAGIPGAPPIGSSTNAPAADPHAGVPGAPPIGTSLQTPAADSSSPPKGFTFEAPTGWRPGAASQFRLASFTISGDGVPDAEMAVTSFPGSVGGDFANVNRWRGQLGLAPVTEAEFAQLTQTLTGKHGAEFVVVEIEGDRPLPATGRPERLLAAILKAPESTFFFKLRGDTSLVASQREAFLNFLRSFHLEDGHAH